MALTCPIPSRNLSWISVYQLEPGSSSNSDLCLPSILSVRDGSRPMVLQPTWTLWFSMSLSAGLDQLSYHLHTHCPLGLLLQFHGPLKLIFMACWTLRSWECFSADGKQVPCLWEVLSSLCYVGSHVLGLETQFLPHICFGSASGGEGLLTVGWRQWRPLWSPEFQLISLVP